MYISTPSITSALDVGGWLMPRPGRLSPGKVTVQEYVWAQQPVWADWVCVYSKSITLFDCSSPPSRTHIADEVTVLRTFCVLCCIVVQLKQAVYFYLLLKKQNEHQNILYLFVHIISTTSRIKVVKHTTQSSLKP